MGMPVRVRSLAGVLVAGVVLTAVLSDAPDEQASSRTVVTQVIDGDTVEIESGDHVRLIGVDTPERGACGFAAATRAMRRMVEGREVTLVNPRSVQDLDRYDRLLRFIEVAGGDAGFRQIRTGRATARYDSRDGYDPHPREHRYHSADRRHEGACGQ